MAAGASAACKAPAVHNEAGAAHTASAGAIDFKEQDSSSSDDGVSRSSSQPVLEIFGGGSSDSSDSDSSDSSGSADSDSTSSGASDNASSEASSSSEATSSDDSEAGCSKPPDAAAAASRPAAAAAVRRAAGASKKFDDGFGALDQLLAQRQRPGELRAGFLAGAAARAPPRTANGAAARPALKRSAQDNANGGTMGGPADPAIVGYLCYVKPLDKILLLVRRRCVPLRLFVSFLLHT